MVASHDSVGHVGLLIARILLLLAEEVFMIHTSRNSPLLQGDQSACENLPTIVMVKIGMM
jgi:hypothetical protein